MGVFYPLIQPRSTGGSYDAYASGFMLTASFLEWCWDALGVETIDRKAPGFDLSLADVEGFPSTTVVTAQFDPLRDQGLDFARRLRSAGAPVRAQDYPGMIHGFAGLPDLTPIADEAITYVADGFRQAMGRI